MDEDSIEIVFNNLQESQYSYPIQSFIREVASNGFDSMNEKEVAYQILKHNKPVSDFYITRESKNGAFKSSKSNPDYYNKVFGA